MKKKDYYKILGIAKDADTKEIKKAYRTLAMKYHPDKNSSPDGEEKFKEINEANECLSNPERRKNYDVMGHDEPMGRQGHYQQSSGFGDFGDIFSDVFGGFNPFGGNQQKREDKNAKRKGETHQAKIKISFLSAILGKDFSEKLVKYVTCINCYGSGAYSPNDVKKCIDCNGSGEQSRKIMTPFGQIVEQIICKTCKGKGKTITKKCSSCSGNGINKTTESPTIKIPAGIKEGQTLIIKGYGGPGQNGGESGDLILIVTIEKHQYYKREGNDILIDLPVSVISILNEEKIKIPTPYGKEEIIIKNDIKSGTIINIKKRGVKNLETGIFGDLKLNIKIYVPKIKDKEREAVAKILDGAKDKFYQDWLSKVIK